MIEIVSPKKLRCNLWRRGPYIVYYSANDEIKQQKIVENIKEIYKTYPFLKVFEVDWKKYTEYEEIFDPDLKNKMILYSNGEIKISIQYPNISDITRIFEESKILSIQNYEKGKKN